LLGTNYGGDGVTTFGLPDLRGRSALHFGQGPGLSFYPLGTKTGQESVTLNITHLPQHQHLLNVSSAPGTQSSPSNAYFGAHRGGYAEAADTTLAAGAVAANGGSQPHSNLSPYLVMNYCIAMQGIFPSRN